MTFERRCLLIADLRHASPRWPALAGGLIAKGWEVTVVTAPLGADAAVELGFPRIFAERARIVACGSATDALEPVRKLLWLLGLRRRQSLIEQLKAQLPAVGTRSAFDVAFQTLLALIGWPDLQAPWRRPALRAARALLREESFDVLVSSSPYPTSHAVAATLKRENPTLRWVADFRDLWAENHNYQMPAWRRAIDRRWERQMLRLADAFTSPTEAWAEQLAKQHGKPGICVPNGYVDYETDTAPAPGPRPAASRQFTLLYTGVRYPNNQEILPLLEAIAALQAEQLIDPETFQFRWIGPFDSETAGWVTELGLQLLVSQEAPVQRIVAKQEQRAAHALLFLQWQDPLTEWSSSLKLHEYVGSGRPILAIGGHDDSAVSRLLAQSGRAQMVHVASECAAVIRKWLAEFRAEGSLRVPDGWEAKARELSGISRGLNALEHVVLGDR
ncbi:MAG: glycosyltransferase [Gemmatimonadetes bacterium]|nr:glycosyltransferase [Gemmatimonadota bacterium]